jgi:DNA-binding MarR family transcriptional regulator
MRPTSQDIQHMVSVLFEVIGGLKRAQRGNLPANRLAMLHVIAAYGSVRPSAVAMELQLNQSSVTRQVQILAAEGAVTIKGDPEDLRACLISLTASGREQLEKLNRIGLARFGLFVADWEADEVRTFTRLLHKFEQSKAAVATRERRPTQPRWRQASHR